MNKRLYILAALLLALFGMRHASVFAETLPDALFLEDSGGKKVKLSQITGKQPGVLAFWTPRSLAATRELEKLIVLSRNLKTDLVIIPISKGENETERLLASEKAKSVGFTGKLYFDPNLKAVKSLMVMSVPWFAIMTGDGAMAGGFNSVESKPRNIAASRMIEMATKGIKIPYHEFISLKPNDSSRALIGKAAPNISAQDISGVKRSLSSYKNKMPVFVVIWRESCPHCREELPKLSDIYKKYGGKAPFEILGVAIAGDQPSAQKSIDFATEHKITFPIILDRDSKISDAYETYAVPAVIYVDKKGIIRETNVGNASDPEKLLLSFLEI